MGVKPIGHKDRPPAPEPTIEEVAPHTLEFLKAVRLARANAGLKPLLGMTPEKEAMFWLTREGDELYERAAYRLPMGDFHGAQYTTQELRELAEEQAKINILAAIQDVQNHISEIDPLSPMSLQIGSLLARPPIELYALLLCTTANEGWRPEWLNWVAVTQDGLTARKRMLSWIESAIK